MCVCFGVCVCVLKCGLVEKQPGRQKEVPYVSDETVSSLLGPVPPPPPSPSALGPSLLRACSIPAGASLAFNFLLGPQRGSSKFDAWMIYPSLPSSPSWRCQLPAFKIALLSSYYKTNPSLLQKRFRKFRKGRRLSPPSSHQQPPCESIVIAKKKKKNQKIPERKKGVVTPTPVGALLLAERARVCSTPWRCARTVGACSSCFWALGTWSSSTRAEPRGTFPAYSDSLLTQFPVWLAGPWVLQGNLPASGPR